jgi:hypothetical protein
MAVGGGVEHHLDHAFDLAVDSDQRADVHAQQRQADVGQPPHQQALGAADVGQGLSQGRQVEAPVGPVAGLPDVEMISAHHAEIMSRNLRMHPINHRESCGD